MKGSATDDNLIFIVESEGKGHFPIFGGAVKERLWRGRNIEKN